MTTNSSQQVSGAFCSELSVRSGLPLIGSAGFYQSVIAFELDPPWTPRLAGSRACDDALSKVIDDMRLNPAVRLLALEPPAVRDRSRVLWMYSDFAGGFARRELDVPKQHLSQTLASLASYEPGGADNADMFGADIADAIGGDWVDEGIRRDILVCTHGSRDACCGKFGYPVFRELSELAAGSKETRVWRSSHLGGHRFAPTLLDLPSGRLFGRMQAGDCQAVMNGGERLRSRLDAIYRGRCSLPEAAQIVEKKLWLGMGDDYDGAALCCSVEASGDSWSVRLEATRTASNAVEQTASPTVDPTVNATGNSAVLSARVQQTLALAVHTPPSCGRDAESEAPWQIIA